MTTSMASKHGPLSNPLPNHPAKVVKNASSGGKGDEEGVKEERIGLVSKEVYNSKDYVDLKGESVSKLIDRRDAVEKYLHTELGVTESLKFKVMSGATKRIEKLREQKRLKILEQQRNRAARRQTNASNAIRRVSTSARNRQSSRNQMRGTVIRMPLGHVDHVSSIKS